jgi:hypothetical protein
VRGKQELRAPSGGLEIEQLARITRIALGLARPSITQRAGQE